MTKEELEEQLHELANASGLTTAECAEVFGVLADSFRDLAADEGE